jgi:hypothetical protein
MSTTFKNLMGNVNEAAARLIKFRERKVKPWRLPWYRVEKIVTPEQLQKTESAR